MTFKEYHRASLEIGDIDPSYEMLRYVSERFELNTEQRYWIAFLYATCYCGPTVFYLYNEFPDFENVDEKRLQSFWDKNKKKLFFQTDRKRIQSNDDFVKIFKSYKQIIGGLSQEDKFFSFRTGNEKLNYDLAFEEMSRVYQFGRFSMFLYRESVHVVTGFPMKPRSMDLDFAESCRNGLAFAIEKPELFDKQLTKSERTFLQNQFDQLIPEMEKEDPRNGVWNVETTLCAYKKYRLGKRFVGYYLDRQRDEIKKLQSSVTEGVDWSVLWDFRKETYLPKLVEGDS